MQRMALHHVSDVCLIGQGDACCRYLVGAADGFRCGKLDVTLSAQIAARLPTMAAKGDNCAGFPVEEKLT